MVTDTAKADLSAIYEHIKRDNPTAAKIFINDLTNKLFSLAKSGVTGSPRDWISSGLRVFPYRERCFYFRIIEDTMIVVRVFIKNKISTHRNLTLSKRIETYTQHFLFG
ncbi:type II toxin-antitoxin system RelE/ParE family toxin [Nitrosomonas sp. H1_AOB3]|uniref:type II toxin-antitoxin system RelE/ParE family toxin n=1 Tax=Nitrosomonas TaxID=914 RepID=UPI00338E8F5B